MLIESSDHTFCSPEVILQTLLEFRPDLVVVIDHLRCELKEVFPPSLPFVTWVQDQLSHLFCTEAGESLWRPADASGGGQYSEATG